MLKAEGQATGLGDEGGFAPDLPGTAAALDTIARRWTRPGSPWAATSCWRWTWPPPSSTATGGTPSRAAAVADELIAYYADLVRDYPLVSIEDPLSEDDWEGWIALTSELGDKVQIVGDDLFVTNPERLEEGITRGAANALLVKVNQIGTLSETLDAVDAGAPSATGA